MSWESTVPYYSQINETVKQRLGGLHSARIVLYSVDFHDVEKLQHAGDWDGRRRHRWPTPRARCRRRAPSSSSCARTRCTRWPPASSRRSRIPLLHIADPTAAEIKKAGHSTVGLIGTRFTMEQAFYRDRLIERHGLKVIVPGPRGPRDDSPHHLRGAVPRRGQGRVAQGVPADHGQPRRARRAGDHPRLHGDFAAGLADRTRRCRCSTPRPSTRARPPKSRSPVDLACPLKSRARRRQGHLRSGHWP